MATLTASPALAQNREPIALRDMGSFHIGGRHIKIKGRPVKEIVFTPGSAPAKVDPNGVYQVEQMYAQYFLVQNRFGKLPLLMWHGGGLTAATYETKPDGNPGWLNYFLRKGWDITISDAMERGRSGWSNIFAGDPVFLPLSDLWERFRIGPPGSWNDEKAKRAIYPGVQFPLESYEQFMKQGVPRWVTTDDAIIAAYLALIDKVCPCVLLVHSQAGSFAFKVAEARPDKIKAMVIAEPSGIGNKDKVAALKNIPIAVIYGDNAKEHPRWGRIRQNVIAYADAIRQAGGSVDLIDLPDIGITGNTHMLMMDRNSDAVADVIQKWFVAKGFVD
jgi:pimeloyl-ACP methyl ester carboxylesterase